MKTVRRKCVLCESAGRMQDSEGIIMSVAPPHSDRMGVGSDLSVCRLLVYILSMRESKRAGGRVCGVDMVNIAEMLGDGSREFATIPPMEWPMTIIDVFSGYNERM